MRRASSCSRSRRTQVTLQIRSSGPNSARAARTSQGVPFRPLDTYRDASQFTRGPPYDGPRRSEFQGYDSAYAISARSTLPRQEPDQPQSRTKTRGRATLFLNIQIEVACAPQIVPASRIGGDKRALASAQIQWSIVGRPLAHVRSRKRLRWSQDRSGRCCRLSTLTRAESRTISRRIVHDPVAMRAGLCLEKSCRRQSAGIIRLEFSSASAIHRIQGHHCRHSRRGRCPSQTSSPCGYIRTRRGKILTCDACGQRADADRNAAGNLR